MHHVVTQPKPFLLGEGIIFLYVSQSELSYRESIVDLKVATLVSLDEWEVARESLVD